MTPRSSHTHLQTAQAATQAKTCQRACKANTDKRPKKNTERTTMAIRNACESADMKAIKLNKLTAKRKVKCFENPHYA